MTGGDFGTTYPAAVNGKVAFCALHQPPSTEGTEGRRGGPGHLPSRPAEWTAGVAPKRFLSALVRYLGADVCREHPVRYIQWLHRTRG